MADGEGEEAASPAMAEMKKRVCDEIAGDAGGKRPRTADLFDELEASRLSPAAAAAAAAAPPLRENGVSITRYEEIATAEVVNASSASASAGDDEGGMRSDVDEEDEFLEETDSDDEEEDDDEEDDDGDDEDDYYSDDSELDAQLGSSNPPRRIEKGIVLDKGKNKVSGSTAAAAAAAADYKGKGKAIVQDEDDDSSSDDSEVGVQMNEEMVQSKMAALRDRDALEDVDLNNILPTRTRRRTIQQPLVAAPPAADHPGNGSSDEDEDYVAGGENDVPGGK